MKTQNTNQMETVYESAAETAKKVRKSLKVAFPGVKFSVRSSTYSMGSSVNVSWTDGPQKAEVERIISQFSSSSFDGMQDMKVSKGYIYEGKLYKGADYVDASRSYSPEYKAQIEAKAAQMGFEMEWGTYNILDMIKAEQALLNPESVELVTEQPETVTDATEQIKHDTESVVTYCVTESERILSEMGKTEATFTEDEYKTFIEKLEAYTDKYHVTQEVIDRLTHGFAYIADAFLYRYTGIIKGNYIVYPKASKVGNSNVIDFQSRRQQREEAKQREEKQKADLELFYNKILPNLEPDEWDEIRNEKDKDRQLELLNSWAYIALMRDKLKNQKS